jgi:hypothetical protein
LKDLLGAQTSAGDDSEIKKGLGLLRLACWFVMAMIWSRN